jgi:hypothetical protein
MKNERSFYFSPTHYTGRVSRGVLVKTRVARAQSKTPPEGGVVGSLRAPLRRGY